MRQIAAMRAFLVLVFAAACGGAPPRSQPQCNVGIAAHAPYPRVPGSLLLAQSPAACPRPHPADGAACTMSDQPPCEYAAPARGVCEYDDCRCQAGTAGAPATWRCGPVEE